MKNIDTAPTHLNTEMISVTYYPFNSLIDIG